MPTVKELIEHLQTLDQDKEIDVLYDYCIVRNPIDCIQEYEEGHYSFVVGT